MKLNQLITLAPNKECESVVTGFQHLDHLISGLFDYYANFHPFPLYKTPLLLYETKHVCG